MVLAGHAFLQVFRTHLPPACFHHLAGNRDLNAQKHIPLTVLAGAGFEEARQSRHLGGIGMAYQGMKQHIHLCKDTLFEGQNIQQVRSWVQNMGR